MNPQINGKKVSSLFPNLLAELARLNISKIELGKRSHICTSAIYAKFKGEHDWTLREMQAVKDVLSEGSGEELTLDYLFKKSNH